MFILTGRRYRAPRRRRSSTVCSSGSPRSRSGSASATSATPRRWPRVACVSARATSPTRAPSRTPSKAPSRCSCGRPRSAATAPSPPTTRPSTPRAPPVPTGSRHQPPGRGGRLPVRPAARARRRVRRTWSKLGVLFVALRNGFYASTLERFAGEARASGPRFARQDGPFSWTAHADLAEVAALAMTSLSAGRRHAAAHGARHAGPR